MARTMSDEQETDERYHANKVGGCVGCRSAWAELDAERAAHERTKAERDYYRDTLLSRHGGECIALLDELTALKARLALAEAVCEHFDSYSVAGGAYSLDLALEALAAWRAAK